MHHPLYNHQNVRINGKPAEAVEDAKNDSKQIGESVDTEKLLENIAEQTKSTRNLYLVYISYLLYFTLSIFSIQDIELLLDSTVTLPFFQVPVATDAFFYLAPVLAIVLYVYFQLHLMDLREMVKELRQYNVEKAAHIFPWLVTKTIAPERNKLPILHRGIVHIALWWLLPLTLLLCTLWIMKKHDSSDSTIVANVFLLGVVSSLYFGLRVSTVALVQKHRQTMRDTIGIIGWPLSVLVWSAWYFILAGVIIPWTNSGGLPLNLYNADVSKKPVNADATRYWAVLHGVNLNGADLRYAYFHRASLESADLRNVNAAYADFSGADLREARLIGADLRHARLDSADLREACLIGADLFDVELHGADLYDAELHGADLRYARLDSADLRYARLIDADLFDAEFHGADFSYARLDSADLRYARLHNTILDSAVFWNTNLKDARELTVEQLHSAKSLYEAKLPDSLLAVLVSGSDLTAAQRRRYQYLRSEESLYD